MPLKLYTAIKNGDFDLVNFLIEEGADVDAVIEDCNYHPPLNFASAKGHVEIVKLLKKNNANINVVDYCGYGYTPLHQACRKGQIEIAKILIEHGADVNATDRNGATPLHLVCKKGYTEIADLLSENKADLNKPNNFKVLPLLLAVFHGRTEIADLLKKNGAKIFAPDDNEELWRDLSRECNIESAKLVIDAVLVKNLEEKKPSCIQPHSEISNYWDEQVIKEKLVWHFSNEGISKVMLATVLDKVRLKKNTLLNASAKALPFFNSPVTNYLTSQNSSKLKTASVEPSSITVLTK